MVVRYALEYCNLTCIFIAVGNLDCVREMFILHDLNFYGSPPRRRSKGSVKMAFSQSILIALFMMVVVFVVLCLLWSVIWLSTIVLTNIQEKFQNTTKQSK